MHPAASTSAAYLAVFWRLLAALGFLTSTLLLPGCGGEAQAKLEDYLEELEFDSPMESDIKVQLGQHHPRKTFRISIAARSQEFSEREPVWMQFKFQLFVAAAPEDEKSVRTAMERHRGMIDDVILSTCRNLTLEELDDDWHTALKSRLIDGLRPLLGEDRIVQVILNSQVCEPL